MATDDVAVALVAEMSSLTVVRRANVFFVTTEQVAMKMRVAVSLARSKRSNRNRMRPFRQTRTAHLVRLPSLMPGSEKRQKLWSRRSVPSKTMTWMR